jgi:glycosyltransferase involved in cell wall biosynthesis
MANLCIEAKNRGIPYIFSLHDHHTEYNGKDSFIFKQNLEAMKGSVFSITHAEHLIEYFNETDKLFYVSHGVNTDFFTPKESNHNPKHKLLMVANNGLAGNQGTDRKGFRYGIESAKELDLEITIVGAEANKEFFVDMEEIKFEENPNTGEYSVFIPFAGDYSNMLDVLKKFKIGKLPYTSPHLR